MGVENPYESTVSPQPSLDDFTGRLLRAVVFGVVSVVCAIMSIAIKGTVFGPATLFALTMMGASDVVLDRWSGTLRYAALAVLSSLAMLVAGLISLTGGFGEEPFARVLAASCAGSGVGAFIMAISYELIAFRAPRINFVVAITAAGVISGAILAAAITSFGDKVSGPIVTILVWQITVGLAWGYFIENSAIPTVVPRIVHQQVTRRGRDADEN